MLNKEVCKSCHNTYYREAKNKGYNFTWNPEDERRWKEKSIVWCPAILAKVMQINNAYGFATGEDQHLRNIKDTDSECWYKAEQKIMDQKDVE